MVAHAGRPLPLRAPCHADVMLTPEDLLVISAEAQHMTVQQWALVSDVRQLLPEATVRLLVHHIDYRKH